MATWPRRSERCACRSLPGSASRASSIRAGDLHELAAELPAAPGEQVVSDNDLHVSRLILDVHEHRDANPLTHCPDRARRGRGGDTGSGEATSSDDSRGEPYSHSKVVQELRRWFDAGQEEVVPGTGAGDVEKMPLGVVDIFQVRVIRGPTRSAPEEESPHRRRP